MLVIIVRMDLPKCRAIIIARGGSKRIPGKNIRSFADEGPIIGLPIRAIKRSKVASHVFVDTDSGEIAREAKLAGAQVPFLREPHLADDHTTTLQVAQASIMRHGFPEDEIVLIAYPANYLRSQHYEQAFQTFASSDRSRMLVSVCSIGLPTSRLFRMNLVNNELLSTAGPELNARTQDLEPAYRDAGKFYMATAGHWMNAASIFESADGFVIPPAYGIDIDSFDDWSFAEATWRGLKLANEQ